MVVEAPIGERIWGANDDRPNRWEAARRRRLWRELGWGEALAHGWPRLQAAELHITVHLRNAARCDPHNYPGGATLKSLIDGLVDARVVPDDDPAHLTVHMPRVAPLEGGRPRVALELRVRDGGS
jgi:hypothetical protein